MFGYHTISSYTTVTMETKLYEMLRCSVLVQEIKQDERSCYRKWKWISVTYSDISYISYVDVAGGYSSSMLDAIRRAVDTSKVLCMQDAELQPLSYKEAFRLATLGGSEGTQ